MFIITCFLLFAAYSTLKVIKLSLELKRLKYELSLVGREKEALMLQYENYKLLNPERVENKKVKTILIKERPS